MVLVFFKKIFLNLRFVFLSLVVFFILFQNSSASERISYKDSIPSLDSEIFNTKKDCEDSDFEFCLFLKNTFYSKEIQKSPSSSKNSSWFRGDLQLFQSKGVKLMYTMGIFYASLFWELRRKASEKQRENDIDKLFFLHRFKLNRDDDIVTAFEKVKILDKELFSSEESLSSLISEVLIERGVLSEIK